MNRQQILEEAIKCVMTDRSATHGEPEDNFKTIAVYWNNYLRSKYQARHDLLDGTDVATMMILMKASRLATSPKKEDHWIDIAGYAACGGGIATNIDFADKVTCHGCNQTVLLADMNIDTVLCNQCMNKKQHHAFTGTKKLCDVCGLREENHA